MSSSPNLTSGQDRTVYNAQMPYNVGEVGDPNASAARASQVGKEWEGLIVNGTFPLQSYLGGSEHSSVFLTTANGQKAAIKLLPADPDNTEFQISLWARATKLSHPNLLRILHTGRCELNRTALLYVVTEFAEEDLSQILPQRALTGTEARDVLRSVLDGLGYIHARGLVHRGIKPANIMAIADQVKLSCDSICSADGPGCSLDRLRPATPYDAPEKAGGRISPAADIWSLGVTLVEVLMQRRPTWDRTSKEEPALPPQLPRPFLEITRNCLRPDPQRRWTVAEIANKLQQDAPAKAAVPAVRPNAMASTPGISAGLGNMAVLRRYALPAIAVCVVIAGTVAIRAHKSNPAEQRTTIQEMEKPPAAIVAPEPAPIQSSAKPSPATPSARVSKSMAPEAGVQRSEPSQMANQAGAERTSIAGPGTTGAVIHQVIPEVPQSARNTIQGHVHVRVRVSVDKAGNVQEATFDSRGPSKYFARLALQAAQEWKFTPAMVNQQAVASQWVLRFAFGRSSTQVVPAQVSSVKPI
jgi:TonB family protein